MDSDTDIRHSVLQAVSLAMLAAFLAACLLVAVAVLAPPAKAHSDGQMHYPPECCHNLDCAPVEKVEMVPAAKYAGLGFQSKMPSIMMVTTKHGTVRIPYDDPNFKPRRSEDGRMHACIRAGSGMTPPKLICFFEPPSM